MAAAGADGEGGGVEGVDVGPAVDGEGEVQVGVGLVAVDEPEERFGKQGELIIGRPARGAARRG